MNGVREDLLAEEQLAGRLDCDLRDQDVPGPGGEEVGNVEAPCPFHDARDPLPVEHALNQLRLGLVLRPGDFDQLAGRASLTQ
jgi:hypothetical protein